MTSTTIPPSTLRSSEDLPTLPVIFFGVGGIVAAGLAIGVILVEPWHQPRELNCRVDLCTQADKMNLPDNRDAETSADLGSGRLITTVATSTAPGTVTPSNATVVSTGK